MAIRIGAALSMTHDARSGAIEAAQEAAAGLEGDRADVAVVFACGSHLAAPEALLEGRPRGAPAHASRRLRRQRGPGGRLRGRVGHGGGGLGRLPLRRLGAHVPRELERRRERRDGVTLTGVPSSTPRPARSCCRTPTRSTRTRCCARCAIRASQMPILGGQASGRTFEGSAALFHDELVLEEGAVGLVFEGVPLHPCVSQGAAPLGPELTITRAEGRIVHELAGQAGAGPAARGLRGAERGRARRIRSGPPARHRDRRRASRSTSRATSSFAASSARTPTRARSRWASTSGLVRSAPPCARCAKRRPRPRSGPRGAPLGARPGRGGGRALLHLHRARSRTVRRRRP